MNLDFNLVDQMIILINLIKIFTFVYYMSHDWFHKVFGFKETNNYNYNQSKFSHHGCYLMFCEQEECPTANSIWTIFDLCDSKYQDSNRVKINIYLEHYRVLQNGEKTGIKRYPGDFIFINIEKQGPYIVLTNTHRKKNWLMHGSEIFNPKKKFESNRIFKYSDPPYSFEEVVIKGSNPPIVFNPGEFTTPTVKELRDKALSLVNKSWYDLIGTTIVRHEKHSDVFEVHSQRDFNGALFQAASQLNCLEFICPSITPENGITRYQSDATQGPACSIAAPVATLYRNYLTPVKYLDTILSQKGQNRKYQINNLDLLDLTLQNNNEKYWKVENGYSNSNCDKLIELNESVNIFSHRDLLIDLIKVGFHRDVEVCFEKRYNLISPAHNRQKVSQVFASALALGYSKCKIPELWAGLASLVLDAQYEATLWASVINAALTGNNKVVLTFLGGGVFGNNPEWIYRAINRAIAKVDGIKLDIILSHHGNINPYIRQVIKPTTMGCSIIKKSKKNNKKNIKKNKYKKKKSNKLN